MSDYIKLNPCDFPRCRGRKVEDATVHIKYTGHFEFNRVAVQRLGKRVSLCAEKSSRNCFAVMRDDGGHEMHDLGVSERMGFSNSSLAKHVLDKTWERDIHAADVKMPSGMTFLIAAMPVDDGENKDVFALIRKK